MSHDAGLSTWLFYDCFDMHVPVVSTFIAPRREHARERGR